MYLIEFKNLDNQDNIIKFNEFLTLTEANTMFVEVINKYKEHGVKSKIWYEIIDKSSKEVIFSSRIVIFDDIENFFDILKNNRKIDDQIKEYVNNVELALENEEITATLGVMDKPDIKEIITEQDSVHDEQTVKKKEEIKEDKNDIYEKNLSTLEDQMKKTMLDLEAIKEQTEQAAQEREQERLKLEQQRRQMEESASAVEEKQQLTEENQLHASNISKLFEEQRKFIDFIKQASLVIRKGTRVAHVKMKRKITKYQRNKQKQQALDIQLKKAKLEFIDEIKNDRKQQERIVLREQKQLEKTASAIKRKEDRYIKELRKRKRGNITVRKVIKLLGILVIIGLIIEFFYSKDQSKLIYLKDKGIEVYQTIVNYFTEYIF